MPKAKCFQYRNDTDADIRYTFEIPNQLKCLLPPSCSLEFIKELVVGPGECGLLMVVARTSTKGKYKFVPQLDCRAQITVSCSLCANSDIEKAD